MLAIDKAFINTQYYFNKFYVKEVEKTYDLLQRCLKHNDQCCEGRHNFEVILDGLNSGADVDKSSKEKMLKILYHDVVNEFDKRHSKIDNSARVVKIYRATLNAIFLKAYPKTK